ncbi:MAG: signal transduction histidine kinase [Planctomycetota bacterium]|jgi:signal transduction histidine kinase
MIREFFSKRWQSLIFRLLFYFLVSMILVAVVLAFSFARGLKPHFQQEVLPNVERYIEYLIDDIGVPPNLQTAAGLASQLPFEIRIKGANTDWSSSPSIKAIAKYEFEQAPRPYRDVYYGHEKSRQFLLVEKNGYQYLFVSEDGFRKRSERRHGWLFLMLLLVFIGLYFTIRRMLSPIHLMSQQVDRIGAGELDQALDLPGTGELAQLSGGINRMSSQIKSMLEAKSALLLAISHELRSPLTRMRVNLELIEDADIQPRLVEDIQEIESMLAAILESERLNVKHAALNLENCALHELVASVVDNHSCHSRMTTKLAPVECSVDKLRISLLLKNLLDNACNYSDPESGDIDISLEPLAEKIVLRVADRGVGISAEDIAEVTDAFYRPDAARQRVTGGYGLGLYLCRLIAEAHQGQLVLSSKPGEGTLVTLELPLST